MLEGLIEGLHVTSAKAAKAAHQWTPTDTNHDGMITGIDIPFEPGSLEAKKAWMQIEAQAHSPANIAKCKALGYENGRGMYAGKPLVPGVGPAQGDWQFLHDRLIYHDGYTPDVASQIAGKIRTTIGK